MPWTAHTKAAGEGKLRPDGTMVGSVFDTEDNPTPVSHVQWSNWPHSSKSMLYEMLVRHSKMMRAACTKEGLDYHKVMHAEAMDGKPAVSILRARREILDLIRRGKTEFGDDRLWDEVGFCGDGDGSDDEETTEEEGGGTGYAASFHNRLPSTNLFGFN